MSPIALASADTPFGQRLVQGFGYPLRGSGLATCVALASVHYVGLLRSSVGVFAERVFHHGRLPATWLKQHPYPRAEASLLLKQLTRQRPDLPQRAEIDIVRSQMALSA